MICYRILSLFLLVASTLGSTWYYDLARTKPVLTGSVKNDVSINIFKKEFIVNAPDRIDYRKQGLVGPVKNKGKDESCYFAAVETIEGLFAKENGVLKQLPVDQVINQTHISRHHPIDVIRAMVDLDNYPVKVKRGILIETPNVEAMKEALAQNAAPLAILLYMSPEMIGVKGHEVLTPTDCKSQEPDQSVLLVGYDKDPESGKTYWIIKNSYGTEYGDSGYLYLDVQSSVSCSVLKNGGATAEIE